MTFYNFKELSFPQRIEYQDSVNAERYWKLGTSPGYHNTFTIVQSLQDAMKLYGEFVCSVVTNNLANPAGICARPAYKYYAFADKPTLDNTLAMCRSCSIQASRLIDIKEISLDEIICLEVMES